MLDSFIRIGLVAVAVLGVLAARYEGASWAYRKAGQSWWGIMRPDRLFRPELYEPAGDRLRRIAQRLYLAFAAFAILLLVAIACRG